MAETRRRRRAAQALPERREAGGAWLYGIAAKELSRWFRRQEVERRAVRRLGVEVPALDDESIARIEALADIEHHREALATALDQMTGGEREAVELRVVSELGYDDRAASSTHRGPGARRCTAHPPA